MKVSEIGFGCWTMGGPNWSPQNGQPIGWADVNEGDVLEAIKVGLDAGVNHWDNADIYGNGRAERLLGACLKKLGVKPGTQVIATKVGHFRGTAPYGYEPRHIRNQCEQSLKNLGVDQIDLYYFHHGAYVGPGYDAQPHDYLHEAAETMHALVKEGKVRAIGQSAYSVEDFEHAVPVLRPNVLQNKANLRYDDFVREDSPMRTLMERHDCSFVAFGPVDQGILLDKFDPDNPPAFEEGDYRRSRKDFTPETLRGVRTKLAEAKQRFGIGTGGATDAGAKEMGVDPVVAGLSSMSCRWLLSHERVCSVIPGFRNARQARCNVRGGVDAPMSPEDAKWLRELFRS
jgi:aryl-alcohol dehydrogenase-like predicted oxidoreductase